MPDVADTLAFGISRAAVLGKVVERAALVCALLLAVIPGYDIEIAYINPFRQNPRQTLMPVESLVKR